MPFAAVNSFWHQLYSCNEVRTKRRILLIELFISFFESPGIAASICAKVMAYSVSTTRYPELTFLLEAMTLLYTFCSVLESVADMAAVWRRAACGDAAVPPGGIVGPNSCGAEENGIEARVAR